MPTACFSLPYFSETVLFRCSQLLLTMQLEKPKHFQVVSCRCFCSALEISKLLRSNFKQLLQLAFFAKFWPMQPLPTQRNKLK